MKKVKQNKIIYRLAHLYKTLIIIEIRSLMLLFAGVEDKNALIDEQMHKTHCTQRF